MAKFLILFCSLAFLASQLKAQSPAPAPSPAEDCTTLVLNMMDCMSFLIEGGDASNPGAVCCREFKMVVAADSQCICDALSVVPTLGIEVNMTRAKALSSDCGVSDFSITACPAAGSIAPVASPVSPAVAPASAPSPSSAKRTEASAPSPKSGAGTIISGTTFYVIYLIIFSIASVIC